MRLNLGSGQRKFGPDWINVDTQAKWEPDVALDGAQYLAQLHPGEVSMICLHHVLEHYGCGEADSLLRECHRVLAPNGSLLIFVPDMRALSEAWREGRLSDQVYMTNIYGAYMGDEADRHKWGFTEQTLKDTLYRIGFRVLSFDWRKIPGADIAKDFWILGVEAIK